VELISQSSNPFFKKQEEIFMNKLKKLVALGLAAGMTLSLSACGSSIPENTVFSVDDLWGKTIGVQLGTTGDIYASDYEEPEDENTPASTIERYNKGNDAVQALKQGKIDCVIIDEQPAKAFVEKNDDLTILDEEFAVEEYAICVSKDNKELTEKINGALAELKEEGTLEQITNNYIGDDTKGTCPYESPADVDRSNGTLVMATNAAFEPYEYYESNEVVGIDADMAQAICDKLGYELKIEDMEFDSIINAVQSGKADIGVAGMTVTEDRLQNIDFTDPYTTATQVIIVRK
jgi:polar amino acid transport system substrate-binding protein